MLDRVDHALPRVPFLDPHRQRVTVERRGVHSDAGVAIQTRQKLVHEPSLRSVASLGGSDVLLVLDVVAEGEVGPVMEMLGAAE